jgi:hypothetical protein
MSVKSDDQSDVIVGRPPAPKMMIRWSTPPEDRAWFPLSASTGYWAGEDSLDEA